MANQDSSSNNLLAADAFSRQSVVFDDIYSGNITIQYKRERVRAHVNKFLPANSNILELNAGTGEDAIYFAQQGHTVHATDISNGMQARLTEKTAALGLQPNITTEICSFTELNSLKGRGPYQHIFSNFAGLNCTDKLPEIIKSLDSLLLPGGTVTMVLLPPFCLWELALALRGNFKAAFRRFNSKNGVQAHIEGVYFTCWYYKESDVIEAAKEKFNVLGVEGLCTIVPPSYFEHFATKHPKLFAWLKGREERLKSTWPWRNIGDYYIITLQKKHR